MIMMMIIISLTRSHSWDMKRPEGNNDWYCRFVKNKVIEKKNNERERESYSWKNTSNFLYDMFTLHEKRKKMTRGKARKALILKKHRNLINYLLWQFQLRIFRTFLFTFKLTANTYFFMTYWWGILWNDLSKLFLICLWSFPHIGVIIDI
jgi:hypothetical protein